MDFTTKHKLYIEDNLDTIDFYADDDNGDKIEIAHIDIDEDGAHFRNADRSVTQMTLALPYVPDEGFFGVAAHTFNAVFDNIKIEKETKDYYFSEDFSEPIEQSTTAPIFRNDPAVSPWLPYEYDAENQAMRSVNGDNVLGIFRSFINPKVYVDVAAVRPDARAAIQNQFVGVRMKDPNAWINSQEGLWVGFCDSSDTGKAEISLMMKRADSAWLDGYRVVGLPEDVSFADLRSVLIDDRPEGIDIYVDRGGLYTKFVSITFGRDVSGAIVNGTIHTFLGTTLQVCSNPNDVSATYTDVEDGYVASMSMADYGFVRMTTADAPDCLFDNWSIQNYSIPNEKEQKLDFEDYAADEILSPAQYHKTGIVTNADVTVRGADDKYLELYSQQSAISLRPAFNKLVQNPAETSFFYAFDNWEGAKTASMKVQLTQNTDFNLSLAQEMDGEDAVNGYGAVVDFSNTYETGKITVAGEEVVLPLKEKTWQDERDNWHSLSLLTKADREDGLRFYLLWDGEAVVPSSGLFELPAFSADTNYGVNLYINNAQGSKLNLDNIKYEAYPAVSMKSCLFDVDKGLVTVLFNGPVDMTTILAQNFAVTDASGAPLTVTGVEKRNASSVNVLLQEPLEVEKNYSVEAKDGMHDLFGVGLIPKTLTGTAAYSSLAVLSTSPENGATEVAVDTPVFITTTTPLDRDTVKAGLSVTSGGEAIKNFTLTYPQPNQIQITLGSYIYGATYKVSLSEVILNELQNPMEPYAFSFTITTNDEQPVYFNDFEADELGTGPAGMINTGSTHFLVDADGDNQALRVSSVENDLTNPMLSHNAPIYAPGQLGKRKISFKIKGIKGNGGFYCGFYNQSTTNAFTQYLDFERAEAQKMLDVGGALKYEIDYDQTWHTVEAYINRTGANAIETTVFWDGRLLGSDSLSATGMENEAIYFYIRAIVQSWRGITEPINCYFDDFSISSFSEPLTMAFEKDSQKPCVVRFRFNRTLTQAPSLRLLSGDKEIPVKEITQNQNDYEIVFAQMPTPGEKAVLELGEIKDVFGEKIAAQQFDMSIALNEEAILYMLNQTTDWTELDGVITAAKPLLSASVWQKYYNLGASDKNTVLKAVYKQKSEITSISALESALLKAIADLPDKDDDNDGDKDSGTSGGGTGGNKGGSIGVPVPSAPPTNVPGQPPEDLEDQRFTDLDGALWAKEAITALADRGIVSGKGDGIFDPNGLVTREEFVKMLVLALNIPLDAAGGGFSDVPDTSWFAPYVYAAQKAGIAEGAFGAFGAGQNISRQDMCVMLSRALAARGASLEQIRNPYPFFDAGEIAAYAKAPIDELYQAKLVNGMENGYFRPRENATRAQAAKMIYDMLKTIEGGAAND